MSNRILVAISEHDADDHLVKAAMALAKTGANAKGDLSELLFLHVIPDGKPESKEMREALQKRADEARALGVNATPQVDFGLAGRIICQYASAPEWHADYIVIGHRDRSAWKEFALGSVSAYVQKHAPAGCTVKVVRPAEATKNSVTKV